MSKGPAHAGAGMTRREALRHTRGQGYFTDDVLPANVAHVAFVRSPWAHARIRSTDTSDAANQPGVVAALTARELSSVCKPWQTRLAALAAHISAPQYPLANGEACWQGEAVAAVLAESRALAEDAAQLIVVDWEPLTAVASLEAALRQDGAQVHSALAGNVALDHTISAGDPVAAMAAADIRVEQRFSFARQTGVTLEGRSIVAHFERRTGVLTVRMSHQVPFQMQDVLATQLGLALHNVRVIAPDVGGAFGLKLHAYGDEIAVAAIALLIDRPVAFACDRLEAFSSDAQSREAQVTGRLGVDRNGRIMALDVDVLAGFGAYSCYPRGSVGEAIQAGQMAGAPYSVPAFRARMRGVYQNKPPNGAYRGVGQPIAVAVTEQLIDLAAGSLGIDPAEMRRMNHLPQSDQGVRTPGGIIVGSVSLDQCLTALKARMDYDGLRLQQDVLRTGKIYRGIGLSTFLELTAVGSQLYGPQHVRVSAHEACRLSLSPSGEFRCDSSITDQGQGTVTGLLQVLSEELSVPPDAISIVTGDTHAVPYGGGAWASRGLALGGEAALKAARRLKQSILQIAAALLQSEPARLSLQGGQVVNADGMAVLALSELAALAHFRSHEIPMVSLPPLEVVESFAPRERPYFTANGVQAAHVEVDVETGVITILGYWVVEDCGRVLNPLLVDEQIRGGIVQGIGAALFEECLYRDDGQLENGSLADYLVPMAAEMPDIEVIHVESRTGESLLGARGVGEAGTVGALGAIWTAVNDALRPLGAAVSQQPFTPERVLEAVHKPRQP